MGEAIVIDDQEEPIDDEQLEEYQEMVENLGVFPDKVKINTLSMVAEDHAESMQNAELIYKIIREPLISRRVTADRKLPLVYVIDSILKNVKGTYIAIIEEDAKTWLPIVHQALSEEKQAKLKKVYNLWKDAGVFAESKWKEMGSCFDEPTGGGGLYSPKLEKAGISSGKDGGLLLMPNLREAMQTILDDLQSDVQDELEKVSLERLALIDADLLIKIKRTAEDSLRNGNAGGTSSNNKANGQPEDDILSFLNETRSPEIIESSKLWAKAKVDYKKESHDIIAALRHLVMEESKSDSTYTQKEAIEMTNSLGAAGAMATALTTALEQIRDDENKSSSAKSILGGGNAKGASAAYYAVDRSLFTNDGIRKKNMAIVGLLYEVGLPFVSSADGRRFATQLELSNHLDALFKKGQLEKSIARTEERGWYVSDAVWSGESKADDQAMAVDETAETTAGSKADEEADPSTFTVPADELRDRCVICGINFKMFFDNDNGIYMYNNCREIEAVDDTGGRRNDEVLVHVSCWRALGAPPTLTFGQILQNMDG